MSASQGVKPDEGVSKMANEGVTNEDAESYAITVAQEIITPGAVCGDEAASKELTLREMGEEEAKRKEEVKGASRHKYFTLEENHTALSVECPGFGLVAGWCGAIYIVPY